MAFRNVVTHPQVHAVLSVGDRQITDPLEIENLLIYFTRRPKNSSYKAPVVTVCTAQWPLYVPYSGQYMYRTVVTVCTAEWSLYVPPV